MGDMADEADEAYDARVSAAFLRRLIATKDYDDSVLKEITWTSADGSRIKIKDMPLERLKNTLKFCLNSDKAKDWVPFLEAELKRR